MPELPRRVPSLSSSPATEVYNPKAVFPHAASLGQACAHCPIFPTAASRRSLDRVSVPMWPYDLSVRLPVFGLVGFYPANCLIGHKSLLRRIAAFTSRLTGYQLRFPAVVPLRRTSPCALLTRPLLSSAIRPKTSNKKPHNLHVLSTPPALILSQDPTLR